MLGANGIVGAGIGLGTGAALSAKLRKSGQVCVVFFGDGAANEGIFHEALNLAALWKLPVVYFCENNQFALSTAMSDSTSIDRLSKRAAGYGIPGETIDGNDVLAVLEATMRPWSGAARRRPDPHRGEDVALGRSLHAGDLPRYRAEADEQDWQRARDPIVARGRLARNQVHSRRLAKLKADADATVEAAVEAAKRDPEPTLDALLPAVSVPHQAALEPPRPGTRTISMVEAIREAIDQEMARDPSVFVIGEDVGKIGGIFACTRGLLEKHGPLRVLDTPISEGIIANAGVGAAIAGMRPIVEIQLFDFVTLMIDAIVNQAAKYRYMLGGAAKVPIVFRGPQGGGVRLGAQHSQSLKAWSVTCRGSSSWRRRRPTTPKAFWPRRSATTIRSSSSSTSCSTCNPKVQCRRKATRCPIGKADIKRPGNDVTVVAIGRMVNLALEAAWRLEKAGTSVEVLDPRTLSPLDDGAILASVKKTGRLVVVDESIHGAASRPISWRS